MLFEEVENINENIILTERLKHLKYSTASSKSEKKELTNRLNNINFTKSNVKNSVYIRRAKKTDLDDILKIFNTISKEEQQFLAYGNKASIIRQTIRNERHCYVAIYQNSIVGFLRESGRPGGFSLLEEIVVHPNYRGKGVATKLIEYYHKNFKKNMAKTNAANYKMKSLLSKYNYVAENPDAPRIINWVRNGE